MKCYSELSTPVNVYIYIFFYQEFVRRYSLLLPRKENGILREEMPGILDSLGLDPGEYQMGREKVRTEEPCGA